MVALLLDAGADVNAREGASGTTPLHWAAYSGRLEVARLLIAHHADCEATDNWHNLTPLGWAAAVGDTPKSEMVNFLLDTGARMDLFSAVALERASDVRAIATVSPAELSRRRNFVEDDHTPLYEAARRNLPDMVGLLLECGADVNITSSWGLTPLCAADTAGHSQSAEVLRRSGAEEDLSLLISTGHIEPARALLQRRPDLIARSGPYALLLHLAARADLARGADLLLEHAADPEALGRLIVDELVCAVTPLHRAALYGHADTAHALLEHAVDPNRRTVGYWDVTALHLAAWHGHLETVKLLIEHGADPSVKDHHGIGTPLEWVTYGDRAAVEAYLKPRTAQN
jgi:ankyrin repeat protein